MFLSLRNTPVPTRAACSADGLCCHTIPCSNISVQRVAVHSRASSLLPVRGQGLMCSNSRGRLGYCSIRAGRAKSDQEVVYFISRAPPNGQVLSIKSIWSSIQKKELFGRHQSKLRHVVVINRIRATIVPLYHDASPVNFADRAAICETVIPLNAVTDF
jgi:hypothetical protein